ncbi:hypothetical protein HMPREF1983_00945 [Gemella bergeri ATCC 700627]|uniref:Uncharacterized protein n=1 Tax=Gemella bergeri ATCC 700627 TaxID=1321820 RepID=U2S4X9_9BACL|nr:hypothetical protein [Gemella bergeri]ERK57842.1 hypothetical protein HMPREF1983_00945 [Gemella bergeri ATCC 700627]
MLGTILEKNKLLITKYIGKGEDERKKFELLLTTNSAPVIKYRGERFVYNWEELIKFAINIIDEKLDGNKNCK